MKSIKRIILWALIVIIAVGGALVSYMGVYIIRDTYYSQAAMEDHYQKMYKRIGIMSGQPFPPLIISEGKEVNAYCTPSNVIVTRGMLNFIKNDDEIALIMGHEISHFILKHPFTAIPEDMNLVEQMFWRVEREENADKLGAFLAMQAGYDVCVGREIMQRMHESGDSIENAGHPTGIFRYVNLHLPQCEEDL